MYFFTHSSCFGQRIFLIKETYWKSVIKILKSCSKNFVRTWTFSNNFWISLSSFMLLNWFYTDTVDSRYLEFDGTMEKIRVNRSSTQEELWKYRKCSLFNDERETTRAKFWRAKTSIACLDSRNDLKLIPCFCCCFFSVKFFESCGMTDNY